MKRLQWFLTPTGKARHAATSLDAGTLCGIPRERIDRAAANPLVDGRLHLLCNRCAGYVHTAQEIDRLDSKTRRGVWHLIPDTIKRLFR